MKRIFCFFLVFLLLCPMALAHPGSTDASGGHHITSNGSYHYHHGYSAHDHKNGVCPYEVLEKVGEIAICSIFVIALLAYPVMSIIQSVKCRISGTPKPEEPKPFNLSDWKKEQEENLPSPEEVKVITSPKSRYYHKMGSHCISPNTMEIVSIAEARRRGKTSCFHCDAYLVRYKVEPRKKD